MLRSQSFVMLAYRNQTSCAGGRHNMPSPCNLTFDLLTLKVVSESPTSVPILVFLCLFILHLGPMYATDIRRQTDRRQTASSLNAHA